MDDYSQKIDVDDIITAMRMNGIKDEDKGPAPMKDVSERSNESGASDSTQEARNSTHNLDGMGEMDAAYVKSGDNKMTLEDEEQALTARLNSAAAAMAPVGGGAGTLESDSERPAKPLERRHLLPDAMEHEEDDTDGIYEYGDVVPDMDNSHVRLKQRMSFLEKMSSSWFRKSMDPDEKKEKLLPQDTFSFMIIAKTCSFPFNASLVIFVLQVTIFLLVILDLATQGQPGNAFGVPANVSAELRATQFIALLVSVLTQGDLRTASILMRDGFNKDFDAAFMDTAPWKFNLSIVARSISGSIGLMVSFVLIITARSVVDLLLNFTAMEFVASIDELCFFLSRQGFLGSRCKTVGNVVANTLYKVRPESRMGCFRRAWKTVSMVAILIIFLSGWSTIVVYQLSGKYVCKTIMLQMGDDFVPALGTFNGLYDLESPGRYMPFSDRRSRYVERRSLKTLSSGRGVLDYCDSLKAWTFRWEFKDDNLHDPCDWVARSSVTMTYDITETMGEPWLVKAAPREVVLDPFRIYCHDCEHEGQENSDDCGGHGTCTDGVCECDGNWYGLRCGFELPCNALAIDARTEEFASTRDWSSKFKTIELESGALVESYSRPVYVHEYPTGDFDVVMFTGRRWALTSSEFLQGGGRISDAELQSRSELYKGTGNDIANFFHFIFHGYSGFDEYQVAFLSDYMDFNTDRDSSSPVGFQWYRSVSRGKTSNEENQGPAKEVDSQFLCEICNNVTNPCLYDGVCDDGVCSCSLDSFGSLCEIPPVRNGHCDPFFNTPEFKMDGGDCCESTCVSTSQYICGAEEAGYVNTGYFSCQLPPDKWQTFPLNGDAGAYFGFDVDLSLRSVAVAELLQDRVRVYDKVGSSWVLRDSIVGSAASRFGTSIAVSAGPYNVVSNPSFLAPLTLVISDGYRTLRVYKCNTEGCTFSQELTLVYEFALSGNGNVLAISVFNEDRSPPTQVRVFESVQGLFVHRADLNVTRNNQLLSLYSMALSGDGNTLVLQGQLADAAGFALYDGFDVRVWNGASYESEAEFPLALDFNAYAYSLCVTVSGDGSVLSFGVPDCEFAEVQVFNRNETSHWVKRKSPLLNTTGCVDSARPKRNNGLSLSQDGSTMAFRLGDGVRAFAWDIESEEWRTVGGDEFTLKSYPVAVSSDGKELAVGSPEEGIGGISTIYSLPGKKECPSGQSLLRVSLTVDIQPDWLRWHLKNNDTGEVLYSEGRYPVEYSFGTIVEEKCVPTDACYEFTVYDEQNRGLQAPGQYALFLDGKDMGRGTFDNLHERVFFGNNCVACPEGTKRFKMLLLTCGPITWNLLRMTGDEQNPYNLLQSGNNTEPITFTDATVYPACSFVDGRLCEEPLDMYYDSCLDPNECYAVVVQAHSKSPVYLELDFDGSKSSQTEVAVCEGTATFTGDLNKCPA